MCSDNLLNKIKNPSAKNGGIFLLAQLACFFQPFTSAMNSAFVFSSLNFPE
jgi:hypothetical protein